MTSRAEARARQQAAIDTLMPAEPAPTNQPTLDGSQP